MLSPVRRCLHLAQQARTPRFGATSPAGRVNPRSARHPWYDAEGRILRLTTDRHRTRDDSGRRLGYNRACAHPVVRRALDRVRNLRYGEAGAWLDRRVSAIEVEGDCRAILCTFLGVVESARGHEYERVLAVRVDEQGNRDVFADPEAWLSLVASGRPTTTRDLWEQAFALWADEARTAALHAARSSFDEIAAPQVLEHLRLLDGERGELDSWVSARADALRWSTAAGPGRALRRVDRTTAMGKSGRSRGAPRGFRHRRRQRPAARRVDRFRTAGSALFSRLGAPAARTSTASSR